MRKIIISLVLAGFSALNVSAQLLYKISGNGLEKPSYIIGTHHLANVDFVNQIVGVNDALKAVDQVYGELVFDETKQSKNAKKIQAYMQLPKGKTLSTLLTKDQLARLNACMKELIGVGMNNPLLAKKMGKLKPNALSVQLTVLMYLTNHMGEFNPSAQFDEYFQVQAKINNKPIGALETIDFQMNTLFNDQPLQRQVEQLMCLVDHRKFMIDMQEEMTKAFYAQDLDAMKKAMDMKMNSSCDATPEESAALIDNRNANWVKQMPAVMAAKSTFFAVGAAHLPGEKGVLNLLKQAGYSVEAVQ